MSYSVLCQPCGRRLPSTSFSKRQLTRGAGARCKTCLLAVETAERSAAASAAAAPSAAASSQQYHCSGCGRDQPAAEFSRTQLVQKDDATRRCRSCLAAAAAGDPPSALPLPPPPLPHATAEPCPRAELARLKATKRLRRSLATLVGRAGADPPVLAFDRFVARGLLREHRKPPSDRHAEPLLPAPSVDDEAAEGLVKDLARVLSREQARDVTAAFIAEVRKAVERLGTVSEGSTEEEAAVVVAERGALLRLSLAGTPKPYVEVSRDHFDRLAELHATSAHRAGGALRSRALCLLLRYQALGAHGNQCALPPACFDVLRERLDVGFECFASPLNARHGRYCSAFADVDSHFGSLGSFFDFNPSEGSFEANPPFVPEVLLAALRHAGALLDAAERAAKPLSFAFVVPSWETLPFHQQLVSSPWLRGRSPLKFGADAHAFVDGAAHIKASAAERTRPSSFATTVGVLQNTAGAEKWPVSDALHAELAEAFAKALPTAGEALKRAARGGGDAVSQLLRRRAREPGDRADGDAEPPPRKKKRERGAET